MAFAAIATADTQSGTVTSNSNSWTLTYPTNLQSGDLILALAGIDGATGAGSTTMTGFKGSTLSNGASSIVVAVRRSDGTESGSITLSLNANEQGSWRVFRITGTAGGALSGAILSNSSGFEEADVACAVASTGSPSNSPNPPSLDPTNWDVEDTLWIAACAIDTSRTISAFPLPDLNTADVSGASNGATLGVCMDDLAQSSLDPGTFTASASDDWVAATIAIRPAAGGGANTYTKAGFGKEHG